jgi:hypothetical protein
MTLPSGTHFPIQVISTIKPINNASFPVVSDVDIEGGYQVRTDLTDRDNIPSSNRKIGMLVYVQSNDTFYTLNGGITNSDWKVKIIDFNIISVKNYGAMGDGYTDDTLAIQSAISISTINNSIIYFPSGTYYITQSITLPDNTTIIGQGATKSILCGPGNHNGFILNNNNYIAHISFTQWLHALNISNINGTSNISIIDCKFYNNSGRAVAVSNSNLSINNVLIEKCYVSNHSGSSNVGGFILLSNTVQNINIHNNVIENLSSTTGGISGIIVGFNDGYGYLMKDIDISHNLIKNISAAGEAHAILCYGERVLITNNRIDSIETSSGDCEGIYTKARMGLISGNTIKNGGSPSGGAIQVKGSERDMPDGTPAGYTMRIINNMIFDDRTGASAYGISAHRGELDISHNIIEGCENSGIYLAPVAVKSVSITDNELVNIRGPSCIEIRNDKQWIHIARNRIHGIINGEGIRLQIATNVNIMQDIIIENNFIYNINSGRGIMLLPTLGSIQRITINNNVIDAPGPLGAIQVSATNASKIWDLICTNNRYITVGTSINLKSTSSNVVGKFPIIRDYSSNDKISFFGVNPILQPTITGDTSSNEALENLLSALQNLGLIKWTT